MFCHQCGKQRSDADKFCAFCGINLNEVDSNSASERETSESNEVSPKVQQGKLVLKSIVEGRMARKEFAIITFVPYLIGVLFAIITDATGIDAIYYIVIPILLLWVLFGYFASIRRLHDLNKSAWWLLLILFAFILTAINQSLKLVGIDTDNFDMSIAGILVNITAIGGFIMLIALTFASGSKEDNRYGEPTKGRKFSWRGSLLNLYTDNEQLDKKYFYTAISIFIGILIVLTTLWFNI